MKKGDIIALILIAVAIISAFLITNLLNKEKSPDFVEITVDGKLYDKLDLRQQDLKKTIKIQQDDGKINIIEIETGRARVKEANCPDEVCVNTGWIDSPGETVVCLPNKVVIKIIGESEDIDGISY
ncbi:MAG: NusG domain II-containing protein [Clostridia bacterium]|nr:NusG domain II-containing protein [Clostridia bacterium]